MVTEVVTLLELLMLNCLKHVTNAYLYVYQLLTFILHYVREVAH